MFSISSIADFRILSSICTASAILSSNTSFYGEYFKYMRKEKQGEALIEEAEKLGVAIDGIYPADSLRIREGALQQRVRNAKNTKYAQMTWIIALISAIASVISAIAAWVAILNR